MRALLAGTAAALLLGGCYHRAGELAELARHHATAPGRVAVLECAKGGRWWYEFEHDGKRRRGVAHDAGCRQRKPGDSVTVYYNPADPAVHRAVAPALAYEEERGFDMPLWLCFAIAALALPLSAWMALKRGARP